MCTLSKLESYPVGGGAGVVVCRTPWAFGPFLGIYIVEVGFRVYKGGVQTGG